MIPCWGKPHITLLVDPTKPSWESSRRLHVTEDTESERLGNFAKVTDLGHYKIKTLLK